MASADVSEIYNSRNAARELSGVILANEDTEDGGCDESKDTKSKEDEDTTCDVCSVAHIQDGESKVIQLGLEEIHAMTTKTAEKEMVA